MNQSTFVTKAEYDKLVRRVAKLEQQVTKSKKRKAKAADRQPEGTPTPYMKRMLAQADREVREGKISPTFTNVDNALAWLHDPKRKYVYQLRKKI